ncbi:MAG: LacI family DNA-binding transcriptional regulator [Chloroflexota bacterium]
MKTKKLQTTIHDVAKAAGVSVSTVSRVLNDKDDVSASTHEKVQKVIEELGYTSNLAARSMRSRKTNVIGLIMPDLEEPFPLEIMKGVNQAITEHDYDLIVYTNGDFRKNSSAQKERHYVSLLNNSIADGVIIVTPTTTTFATDAPVVAVDPNNESPDCPAVIAANRDGALQVMDYLTSLGHRRIGYIGGRRDLQSAIRREKGYLDGLKKAGIQVDPQLISDGDFTLESGVECGRKLLDLPNRPTAIFAANDQSAFGAIEAAESLGLRVPEDVSIVGFDNIPESKYAYAQGLTTVDQSVRQMGITAAEMLFDLINGKELENSMKKLPTQLIKRNSCSPV